MWHCICSSYLGEASYMYNKNKDILLLRFFGFIYYAIVVGMNGHLTKVPLGEYFLVPFITSIFLGMGISRSSQMLEWPLCFLFGGTTGSLTIMAVLTVLGMKFTIISIAFTLSNTLAWFGVISVMILLGILLGAFLRATYTLILGSLRINFD